MYKKLLLISLFFSTQLMAHGLELDVKYKAPVIILKAVYDDHKAIANAKISIHPPDYKENIFQSGITDINGIFVFIPDSPGNWIASVDDETGHKTEEVIAVEASFFTVKSNLIPPVNTQQTAEPCRIPIWIKLLLGFLIIFSLTLMMYCKKRLSKE